MRANAFRATLAGLAISVSALSLGGCDTVQESLGLGKVPPDEMAVAPRRPLAMPPDYNLRPPQPGAPAPADINASNAAARALATSGEGAGEATAPPVTDGGRTMTTSPASPPAE